MPGLLFMYTINLIACHSSLVYWFTHLKPFHINVGVPHFLSTCCSPSLFILVSTVLVSESWQLKQYCVHSWCSTDEEYAEIISLYMIKGRTKRSQRLLNMQSSTFLEIYEFCSIFCQVSQKYKIISGYIYMTISQYHSDTGRLSIFCQANCHNPEMPDNIPNQFPPLQFNEDIKKKNNTHTKN